MGTLLWLFQFLVYFLHCNQVVNAFYNSSSISTFSSSAHYPLCRHDQMSALLQFKHMFTIDSYASDCIPSYPKTLSWNENSDCCLWDGVTCDWLSGHVIGLDLSCSQLYGTIHPNSSSLFTQLSHLQWLNLAYNNFTSSGIPYAFGKLASLTHLNLSYSSFSGSVPSEIFHLSKLISLDLSSNWLTLEPLHFRTLLKNLTQLRILVLSDVNITSVVPDFLTNLSSLTTLDLSLNRLQGNLPDNIFHLPNLEKLYLQFNLDLNVNLPKVTWRSGSSLRELDLSYTILYVELPDSIGLLKCLTHLDLSESGLQGEVSSTLSKLKQLTFLNLEGNLLQGKVPDIFGDQLTYLNLRSNNFSGGIPVPSNLSGLQNLQHLDLSVNSLSGLIPSWSFTLPSLLILNLDDNRISGQIPEFRHDSPLEYIALSSNKLHGPIPQSMSTLVNLTYLNLASNNLSGVLDLQILKKLEFLALSNTNLTTRSNTNTALPNLWYFYMSSCKIKEFPDFLRTSEILDSLDLSDNSIRGQIPNWFGFVSKTSLSYLNLSHNFLTGIKQHSWAKLQVFDLHSNLLQGPLPIPSLSTRYFFISHNSLSGEIPLPICNVSSLVILDLSHNKLSGAIPQCLGNFSTDLSVLDLHSNEFHGTIPLTFAEDNLLRNLDLNGNKFAGPLPRSLTSCTSLEVLDVGNNKINDTFPNWLGTLPELQVLVLRSNRFHGSIDTSECGDNQARVKPLVLQQEEDDSDFDGFTWRIVVIGYGCGMAVGLFMGFLMFKIGRPKFFVRLAEREKPMKVRRSRRTGSRQIGRRN